MPKKKLWSQVSSVASPALKQSMSNDFGTDTKSADEKWDDSHIFLIKCDISSVPT